MEIIPFGKYKGQPIEAMQNDKQYIDWLIQQDWFKQRYQNLNAIIINNFQQVAETPEHNRLQALFTDDAFLVNIIRYLHLNYPRLFNTCYRGNISNWEELINSIRKSGIDYNAEFEKDGVDVTINTIIYKDEASYIIGNIKVEIKQTIGDDYPAVLRQMHANGSIVLFAEKFNSISVTIQQVRKMFGDKIIILMNEI